MKKDICSMYPGELEAELIAMGEAPYRAGQIFEWLHAKNAASFDEMTNISKSLRARLDDEYYIAVPEPVQVLDSKIDGTKKFLFRLYDGNVIESVRMEYKYGSSLCISSQAGCRMGCKFCASTIGGLERSLNPSEMLWQVYRVQALTGGRISHVVVMGSGEPMDNYDSFVRFVRLITDRKGSDLSVRSITVSTCGIPDRIRQLADEGLGITLALSLHAPSDEIRRKIMPIAYRYPLSEVLAACDYYFEKTGRRVSYEYSLIRGVNDSPEDARALAALIAKRPVHVNLIPINPVKERDFSRPGGERTAVFKNTLEKNGINATIRREMGQDINGACGQLRRSYKES